MTTQRKILYWILIIFSLWILWYSYIISNSPYWDWRLYGTELLAQVPTDCEWECQRIEYYRDMKDKCILKKVLIQYNEDQESIASIQEVTLQERVEEKWRQVYMMWPDTHTPFTQYCYNFDTRSYIN